MLKLSTKGRYGVRLMLDLAMHFGCGPVPLKGIAQRQEISEKYLGNLIVPLKNAGLINSSRGPSGGYLLSRPPKKINLKEVISVLEGPMCLVDCVNDPSVCKRSDKCVARDVWKETTQKMLQVFSRITLERMANKQKHKEEQ